jgi:hypothetical protein
MEVGSPPTSQPKQTRRWCHQSVGFFVRFQAGFLTQGRRDRLPSRRQQSAVPLLRESRVHRHQVLLRSEPADQMLGRRPAARRRDHTYRSSGRARGKARRWRSCRSALLSVDPRCQFSDYPDNRESGAQRFRLRALEPGRRGRIGGFKFCEAVLQAESIELADREYTDAALRAPRAAYEPRAAATGGVGECGVDDLNQLPVPGRQGGAMHR